MAEGDFLLMAIFHQSPPQEVVFAIAFALWSLDWFRIILLRISELISEHEEPWELDYADDFVLLSTNPTKLQELLDNLNGDVAHHNE